MSGSTDFAVIGWIGEKERFIACLTWTRERAEKYIAEKAPGYYPQATRFTIEGPVPHV